MESNKKQQASDSLDFIVSERISEMLKSIPSVGAIRVQSNSNGYGAADLVITAKVASRAWQLAVEVSRSGQPRIVRNSIALWEQWCRRNNVKKTYFVFASPFISTKSQEICKDAGVGFVDLAGNCRLAFDNIFIERVGLSAEPEKRSLRSLFNAKSSRVIRRLLTNPEHPWHVHELAKSAAVSTGLVSQIKTKLIDSELAQRRADAFVISNPEELLRRWAQAYQFDRHRQVQLYSSKSLTELEQALADICSLKNVEYAFTLLSGAGMVGSQYVRVVNRAFAYVSSDIQSIENALGVKRVDTGGNLVLLSPSDPDIFFGKRPIHDCWVVSDLQLYLDFSAQKGRTQETAEFLLDSTIRKSWGR